MAESARAIVVLTPAESKRLIAMAVTSLPEVKRALKKGRVIIGSGTTNACIVEELTGKRIDRFWYAAGRITGGELGANELERRLPPAVFVNGKPSRKRSVDVLNDFTADDVFIKGANAVDASGAAGVLMGDPRGGTIGSSIGIVMARGAHLIVPVGLEKLVPSVAAATRACGQGRFDYATGDRVGMIPLIGACVITELEAVKLLYGIEAVHVASGGVEGSEGSVVLALEGEKKVVRSTFTSLKKIKSTLS
ncbi:MAG: hypothetical protein ACE5GF_02615 [Thermodesulfobacteriota bacterium]